MYRSFPDDFPEFVQRLDEEADSTSTGKFLKKRLGFNQGGKIPGYGGGDTVPALLEKGEYVINKQSTSQFLPVIQAINGGKIRGFEGGGQVYAFWWETDNRL